MNSQLFYIGDILQMRDKSQWEIRDCRMNNGNYLYDYKNLTTKEYQWDFEESLNKRAIVIQFAEIPKDKRPFAKVYYLDEYRRKKVG